MGASLFVFHGLRKNAGYCLFELAMNECEISLMGMSPQIVLHYGKRTRALMIARGGAARVMAGTIITMKGAARD